VRALKIELRDELIPYRRPHFELRGDAVFFVVSTRPAAVLDAQDQELWRRIDGKASVGALRRAVPDAGNRLRRFHSSQLCELADAHFPTGRRRVLVIEPHMDDAVLSVGGSMWAMRNECEFIVATIAGSSNYTSYFDLDRDFFDVSRVTSLRKAESALAMRLVGGRHLALDLPEAPLRFHDGRWTLDWYRRHRKQVEAFIMHAATDSEIETWADAIAGLASETNADETWMPLGVGSHTDHELARNAVLRAVSRGDARLSAPIFFYQEVPYAAQFPGHTGDIVNAIEIAGGRLEARSADVTESFDAKLRLVSIYGSQFKPHFMAARVEEAARRASGSGNALHELRFQLTALPGAVDPLAAYSGRDDVEPVITSLRPWHAKHRDAARIRILTPVPLSRWKDDLTLVLEAFPRATIEVHVSEEYADEAGALVSPRIEVRVVAGREGAWLRRLAGAMARPMPTILLTGERLRPLTPVANRMLPGSDVVAATRMNHFVLALRRITSS
jgi:LmbE family N-acetylglucosaminyl deacetylase